MDTTAPQEFSQDEQQIALCVRRFYQKAQKDPKLGPVFKQTISNWEEHYQIVQNFWSRILLGTKRYSGMPYPAHARLPISPQHFDRWLELFMDTCKETMSAELAERAIVKARMMASSIRMGMFPEAEQKLY